MTTVERDVPADRWALPHAGISREDGFQVLLILTAIVGTVTSWSNVRILYPTVALWLFVAAVIGGILALLPWIARRPRLHVLVLSLYMLSGVLMMPLAHATSTAAFLPFAAAAAAGGKLASRAAAVAIAGGGAIVAAIATRVCEVLAPTAQQWPWWVALAVGLPVLMGISHRDRRESLWNAHRAAEQAQRAGESEAREAALLERARIAREIHDVLGHSLSGIALQLDLADGMYEGGRNDEAIAAVHRARALAVSSIGEARNAVHALREQTLPVPDTLRRLAEDDTVEFDTTGEAGEIGPEASHTIVRVAQEALTNATKYAPGAPRTMDLTFTPERVALRVHNGPSAHAPRTDLAGGTGVGLVGMRERAALLGGTLLAEPAGDGGWTVELRLPRKPPD
ncbi:sensor histidine kinase [Nocardia alni]|uniref:sensor histidine kinase n=1 Tax=Nocardia alni TaxID=2815723 RepID=UPI001C217A9F|nr:histidine kinase [Nocardia alni]